MRKILYIIPLLLAFAFTGNPPGWYQQTLPVNDFVNDIFFIDTLTGWVVTQGHTNNNDTGYIMKTINGGDNWTVQYARNVNLTTVQFVDQQTGYVGGGSGTGTIFIYKTTNGGDNWIEIIGTTAGTVVDDIQFINADTGWFCDDSSLDGGLYKTTNGGINWIQQMNNSYFPLKMSFINKDTGWVGTSNSELYKTTNGGNNWNLQFTFSSNILSLGFANKDTAWTLLQGSSGTIMKTTNGGTTWSPQILPHNSEILLWLREIQVINSNKLWVAGGTRFYGMGIFRGILYVTTDGGDNWGYQLHDTSLQILSFDRLFFLKDSIGWAYTSSRGVHTVTDGDSILFTSIKQLSSPIPSNFKLFHNYPNPFNPTTNIRFSIRNLEFISLKVYDIQGREIAVLVNEKLQPGEYEYKFDGTGLTSGVYFYKLEADNFSDTKKMLMVK